MTDKEYEHSMPQNTQQVITTLKAAIADKRVEVPVLPKTAQKVLELIQDPDSDANQLSTIIQSDPTLSGHVMRVANSSAYSPNSNLVSLQQAIARLGMIEISNIAFSTSLNCKMFNAPGYEQHVKSIWQHALVSALWGKEIARAMRSNVEAAFLCSLLHTIGKPAILQTIADCSDQVLTETEIVFIYDQFELSYSETVADEWDLPSIIRESIAHYKDFQLAPNDPQLAATVAFSHILANFMLEPEKHEKQVIFDSSALDMLNLYPDEVFSLLDKQELITASMNSLLM